MNSYFAARKGGRQKVQAPKAGVGKNVRAGLNDRPLAAENTIGRLFSVLPADVELIENLAKKFDRKGARINNSEVVRAGLMALAGMSNDEWLNLLSRLPKCAGRWRDKKAGKARANFKAEK
jgi:hypothetical protein